MNLDMTRGKIHLVLCPTDLRLGYNRLAGIAQQYFNIDLSKGKDWMVFVSTRRNVAKIIHHDSKGVVLITRRLHEGKYQRLKALAEDPALKEIKAELLMKYLDGEEISINRTGYLKY